MGFAVSGITMLFSASLISSLLLLSVAKAAPQGFDALEARASCLAGFYPNTNGTCTICPPGHYCSDGRSLSQCGTGQAQPKNGTKTPCPDCPSGEYQPSQGQANCIPAPKGGYVLNPGSSSYNVASGGSFQGITGQNHTCITCCGYYAITNGNTAATRCAPGTYSYPGSSSACTKQKATCVVPATCFQKANGTCPAGTRDH